MRSDRHVRVRFAPSPTGPLHVGGARTALFNWIFAKAHKGEFVLRIEDTDKERSKKEFEEEIETGLRWLGISWDEFYRQSERAGIHRKHLEKLLGERKAYYCFCTKEELEADRQAMLAEGVAPKYSGRCRALEEKEITERLGGGEEHVIRFKVPETKVAFKDLIRGSISFDASLMGDVVIARDLDQPLYNFAVVVDDALTSITHVIRGEEHISNTPRQILIMNALGFSVPEFAHLPIILNPDRSKMSKRFSDTALKDYITDGYLSDAMVNFLAYLGWHPKEDREIMSLEEIVEEFDLKRVQKGGAIFNIEKLEWLNSQYIQNMGERELAAVASEFVPSGWKLTPEVIKAVKGRVKKLREVKDLVDFYFELPDYNSALLRWRDAPMKEVGQNLERALEITEGVSDKKFEQSHLEKIFLDIIPKESRGDVLWPLRVALSGKKESPSPFEIMEALGKKETVRRLTAAMEKIGKLDI